MRPSLFLHQLIHALSPKERAGFLKTLQGGKKGDDSLYLKLFRSLERQKAYDEAAIRHHFEGTSFGRSLGFPKSHLYDRLLAHLHTLHLGATTASQLRMELGQVELLADRGLPAQALRRIEKGLQLAEALEDAAAVLQFLRLKRRQVMQLQVAQLPAEMAAISEQESRWMAAFQQELAATRLHDALFSTFQEIRRKARAADDPHLQSLWTQLNHLLGSPGMGFPATVVALRACSHFHHMREDFRAVHDAYQAEIQVWEAHPHQIQHASLRYVRLVGQWLTSKALIGDFEGISSETQRLRNRPGLDIRSEAEVFQTSYTLELYHYLNTGRPQDALPLVEAIDSGLQQYEPQLSPSVKLGLYYNLALVHWLSGQHSVALKWVYRILQFETGTMRKDIRDFAPLLEKVLHYELGNTSLLESWFRAARYRQRKHANVLALEDLLLALIQGLLASDHHSRLFQTFRTGLDTLAEQPGVSKLGIHELQEWARLRG